jgi:DNA segregation ATPase FtsK/SpoIIIE, S-DNA-T family
VFSRPTLFNRVPRVQYPDLSQVELELPNAPERNETSDIHWSIALMPLMGFGTMALFYLSRGNAMNAILPLVILAGVSIFSTIMLHRWRGRSAQKQQEQRQRDYERLLTNKEIRLHATQKAFMGMWANLYPTPAELFAKALDNAPNLWERRPQDVDFMRYRLGIGRVALPIHVKTADIDSLRGEDERILRLLERYRTLNGAPFVASLKDDGATAIVSKRSMALASVRAIVTQVALAHAPQDLQITVIAPTSAITDWDWAAWLPHVQQNEPLSVAFTPSTTRNTLGYLSQVLDQRRETQTQSPFILVVIDDPHALQSDPAYTLLLREGERWGVGVLCVVNAYSDVPSDCKTVLHIEVGGTFRYQKIGVGGMVWQGELIDQLPLTETTHIARALAPIQVAESETNGRVPSQVELLELYQISRVQHLTIQLAQRWTRPLDGVFPRPVPIGRESLTTETMLWLDETHHGPHGMLAGTTGSGKSELLQSLVCALAIEHDPRFLTFLLIDFKGGSTFRPFENLPHTVGMVTNLDVAEVRRVLEALKSDIEGRQQFLKEINVRDIHQYHRFYTTEERLKHPDYRPMPRLVIVVDEFAQLAREMPEFLSELVKTAQVGRSLGLHLILGTQSPMDVITDEMNANLQFRICLRVQNATASRSMLQRPDAAYLPSNRPGRGYLQVGERGLFKQFQGAYSGSEFQENPTEDQSILELMRATGDTLNLLKDSATLLNSSEPYSVAHAISDTIRAYVQQQRVPMPKRLLLPSLPQRHTLLNVHSGISGGCDGYRWVTSLDERGQVIPIGSAPIGLVDDVVNRTQYPLWINFNLSSQHPRLNEGHLLVVGAPASGKTTLLRTLALSLGVLHSPDALQMYFLSFTGAGLNTVSQLPHAEKVVTGAEPERVRRLFSRLLKTLDSRLNQASTVPHIVLFIDQYEQFREMYRDAHGQDLERIINEGRAVNIYVVLTASSITAIPDRTRAMIPQRIALQQASPADYVLTVGRVLQNIEAPFVQGRGFIHASPPLLMQVCLPSLNPLVTLNDSSVQESLSQAVNALQDAYRLMSLGQGNSHLYLQAPSQLTELPQKVTLAQLSPLQNSPAHVVTPLGWTDDDGLSVYSLDWWNDGVHFVVVGPPASGKTNLLQQVILSGARQHSPAQLRFLLVDFNQRSLRPLENLKHVIHRATDVLELKVQLNNLQAELTAFQRQGGILPVTALVIDDYELFVDVLANDYDVLHQLRHLTRFYNDVPFHVWVAGYLERPADPFIKQLLMRRSGLGLVTRESLQRLNLRTAHLSSELMTVGRAFVPQGNRVDVVQTAWVEDVTRYVNQLNDQVWIDDMNAHWFYPASKAQDFTRQANRFSLDSLDIDTQGLVDDLLNGNPNDVE